MNIRIERLGQGERIAAGSALALFTCMFLSWFNFSYTASNAWESLHYTSPILAISIVATLGIALAEVREFDIGDIPGGPRRLRPRLRLGAADPLPANRPDLDPGHRGGLDQWHRRGRRLPRLLRRLGDRRRRLHHHRRQGGRPAEIALAERLGHEPGAFLCAPPPQPPAQPQAAATATPPAPAAAPPVRSTPPHSPAQLCRPGAGTASCRRCRPESARRARLPFRPCLRATR